MHHERNHAHVPPAAVAYGRFEPSGPGPTPAMDFERWRQDGENPVELIGGWVLPMTPGDFETGAAWTDLAVVLGPLVKARRWCISQDARHRLPAPPNTVVYPDIAIHTVPKVRYLPGTRSVGRVPDLVIELLSEETHERDTPPRGAKFLAYQASGVREYYVSWPDGRGAAGFALRRGRFVPVARDVQGFFASPLLGCGFRLVVAATQPSPRKR